MITRLSPFRGWFTFLFLLMICPSNAFPQDDGDDEPPEFLPGLVAQLDLPKVGLVTRLDHDVLFDWSEKSVDHRTASQSPIKVRWTGYLECKDNGQFKIHVYAAGRITVRIDGREILKSASESPRWFDSLPLEMKFGRHPIELAYEGIGSRRQIGLFWTGPQFELEPISHRYLSHRFENAIDDSFERGALLSRALGCAACHEGNDVRAPLTAPALTCLDGNLNREWLVERLTATGSTPDQRMPHFGLIREDAEAISVTLFDASQKSTAAKQYVKPLESKAKQNVAVARTEPSVAEGRAVLVSLGCLACHQLGELGDRSLFDGGDLSLVAAKRTQDFYGRWLENPATVNSDHRMPVFKLSALQSADLQLFLQSLGPATTASLKSIGSGYPDRDIRARGKQLIAAHRCAACHKLPTALTATVKRTALRSPSDWESGCLQTGDAQLRRPGFGLANADRQALKAFWTNAEPNSIARVDGRQLILEQNCLGCHSRDLATGMARTLAKLATLEPGISPRLGALGPPSLTGVGDKLHRAAMVAVLAGNDPPRRPWLVVQMPKFRLTDAEMKAMVSELVAHDRIPNTQTAASESPSAHLSGAHLPSALATELAAARLVTAEGFGCQSCHKIGSVQPPQVAINAQGTDLTMLGDRIRPGWFRRWVHNPARIVPRMEMPAIQVAAKGVLNDDLDLQLAALWKTLNTPGFEPPKPNPVRVVRNLNNGTAEHANVLTDVLETSNTKYLRPLIIGLPNRHNILFDLETGRLASWWVGDTARQYTRGKSWYWEAGAPSIVDGIQFLQQFSIVDSSNRVWQAKTQGQFVVQFDGLKHVNGTVEWSGRIELQNESNSRFVKLTQRMLASGESELEVVTQLNDLLDGDQVAIEVAPQTVLNAKAAVVTAALNDYATAVWSSPMRLRVQDATHLRLDNYQASQRLQWSCRLSTKLPVDRWQPVTAPYVVSALVKLNIVPGYEAVQLPLPRNEMPTAIAWRETGEMFVASLKGRVLKVNDADADGLGDAFEVMSDDLPAPYGLAVNADSVDVLCKTSLIRLTQSDAGGEENSPFDLTVVADGWGYTSDYHDWAVGLERDADGCYYMALPCQQDDRSEAAAKLRGHALKLVPYQSIESSRAFRIETISAGLRFPMGLALNSSGDLFATDNQGNYNPFNELNHLQFGKRYGFINKLEAKPGFPPDFESPAVNLPHPWTRSVNGLCFLNTPAKLAESGKQNVFGPFEGDFVGCEYNGLSLIRMSVHKVRGQYQGAAYMFSRTPAGNEATFEGPVTCEVSPDGGLFVGSIHDSGWGGGQNTGSIVRLRPMGELPLGIDEVRATATGFEIAFTQPVDAVRAIKAESYSIRSYRRISTPAYGGDDQDNRSEPVRGLRISSDLKTVTLQLNNLRAGYVYEINVGSVGGGETAIFPSQAHYNMRAVPID